MADQVTTIASFPAGFATLAGLVYAVVATPQQVWSQTCWSKIRLSKSPNRVHPTYGRNSILDDVGPSQTAGLERLCYKFARGVTTSLQGFYRIRRGEEQDKKLRIQIAVLHLLMWHRRIAAQTTSSSAMPGGANLSSTAPGITGTGTIGDALELHAMPPTGTPPGLEVTVTVNIVDHRGKAVTEGDCEVSLTQEKLRNLVAQADFNGPINSNIKCLVIDADVEERLPKVVYAQAAAPWDVLITEIGFKGIEALFAAGIILGSSGGAWLGLTLASIFPQRVAAGLYTSSFGQVAVPKKSDESVDLHMEHVFITPGTLWVDGDTGYCMRPCLGWRWFDDTVRNTLGYVMQYILMYLLTWYKMRLRTFFFPEGYRKTVDNVRYVVLVIEPVVLLVWFWRLITQRQIDRLRLGLLGVYIVILATAIVCMIFGQRNFLRTYWHMEFEQVPRLLDPIASAGAVAAMHARGDSDAREVDARDVTHGQWGLIWAIGVCTAVW
jgi:pimeloyl-ACP methyl ester carboxylesterase